MEQGSKYTATATGFSDVACFWTSSFMIILVELVTYLGGLILISNGKKDELRC